MLRRGEVERGARGEPPGDTTPTRWRRWGASSRRTPPRRRPRRRSAPAAGPPARALDRGGTHRRRPHVGVGDPHPGEPAGRVLQLRGDGEQRNALRPHLGHLEEAKRTPVAGAGELDSDSDSTRRGIAVAQKFLQRHVARTVSALHRDPGVEREQRGGKVAVGRRGEQVAADRRLRAHRGPADGAGGRVEKGEIGNFENPRHGDSGADAHPRARGVGVGQRAVRAAHQGREIGDIFVEGPHEQCAASEKASGRITPDQGRGVAQRLESLQPYRHRTLSTAGIAAIAARWAVGGVLAQRRQPRAAPLARSAWRAVTTAGRHAHDGIRATPPARLPLQCVRPAPSRPP